MAVVVVKDGLGVIAKTVLALTKSEVRIGIPEGSDRSADKDKSSSLSNAEIGYINEFGAPEANIPARPFLVPGVQSITPQAAELLRKAAREALVGNRGAVDAALNRIGLIAQSAVQEQITDGSFAPLSEVTLKRRRAKGRTGEEPLIDSGQLRRSVTYIVKRKGQ